MKNTNDAGTVEAANRALMEELSLVSEETRWWRALLGILKAQGDQEIGLALLPDISNDLRNYRAGRAAALGDFEQGLRELLAAAREEQG